MHRPLRAHTGVELDLAEGAFVSRDVLLEQSKQSLGLLGAEIDPLKVPDFDLRFTLLLQRAKDKKEIPNVHAHASRAFAERCATTLVQMTKTVRGMMVFGWKTSAKSGANHG